MVGVIVLAGGSKPRAYDPFMNGETLLSAALRGAAAAQQQLDPNRLTTVVLSSTTHYQGPISVPCLHIFEQEAAGALPAVVAALNYWNDHAIKLPANVIVTYGDLPLITKDTFATVAIDHVEHQRAMTVLAVNYKAPEEARLPAVSGGWGKLVLNEDLKLLRIGGVGREIIGAEGMDQDEIDEINRQVLDPRYLALGVFVVRVDALVSCWREVPKGYRGQFWLEDLVLTLRNRDMRVSYTVLEDWRQAVSVDTPAQLGLAVQRHRQLQPA